MMKELKELPQDIFIALDNNPYRTLGPVGNPPHKIQSGRFLKSEVTKVDALHQADDSGFQTSR